MRGKVEASIKRIFIISLSTKMINKAEGMRKWFLIPKGAHNVYSYTRDRPATATGRDTPPRWRRVTIPC